MDKNLKSTYIERAGDSLRMSIRGIHFVTEANVNVMQVEYQIQDKKASNIVNPHTQEARSGIYVYEKATFNANTAVEPLLEDMLYACKAVVEEYLARKMNMASEAVGKFDVKNNLFIQKLQELSNKENKDGKQLELFENE